MKILAAAPISVSWEDAFNFAHEEGCRSIDAAQHGDFVGASILLESAVEANRLAKCLFDEVA
jgi:hypothetical protein